MDISLVIPFFNEEDALPALFQALEPFLKEAAQRNVEIELVFADDGSRDGSLGLVQNHFGNRPCTQILHWKENRGVGFAMREGFAKATKPAVVCYDSDATYPLSQVFFMVSALEDADVVTASPFLEGGGVEDVPSYRLVFSRVLSLLYRRLSRGKSLSTFSCGFRAYRKECLEKLPFEADGFLATAQILYRAVEKGMRIKEIPSTLSRRKYGRSKMPLIRTVFSHLGFLSPLYLKGFFRPFKKGRIVAAHGKDGSEDFSFGEKERDDQRALATWNSRLNQNYPMDGMLASANPLVRFAEKRRRKMLIRLADHPNGGILVDLGSEKGGIARALRPRFRAVCCVDIDAKVLQEAQRENESSSTLFLQGDIQRLGLRSGLADVVLLSAVLEHLPAPRKGLEEAVRITGKGGKVVICVPNDSLILKIKGVFNALRIGRALGPLKGKAAPGHLHVLNRKEIAAMIPPAASVRRFFLHFPSLCYFLVLEKEG